MSTEATETKDTVRLNLTVGSDVPDKILALSGSQRRMGEWITDMVRQAYREQTAPKPQREFVQAMHSNFGAYINMLEQILDDLQRKGIDVLSDKAGEENNEVTITD